MSFNPLTADWALRALIDFTLSNARRFYLSMGNPLDGKGLSNHDDYGNNVINFAYLIMKNSSFARFARAFLIFGHLRPRPHVSGYFWIRKFFFPDTAIVQAHAYGEFASKSGNFLTRSPKWKFLNPITFRVPFGRSNPDIFWYDVVTKLAPIFTSQI